MYCHLQSESLSFNNLCVGILFKKASSHPCFRFFVTCGGVRSQDEDSSNGTCMQLPALRHIVPVSAQL